MRVLLDQPNKPGSTVSAVIQRFPVGRDCPTSIPGHSSNTRELLRLQESTAG